jgi:predicted ATPase/class 3 adenylate cyclase
MYAFMFTDIEGSTRRWQAFPDAMASDLADHDRILLDAIEQSSGSVFFNGGDGMGAVFINAADAVKAAGSIQTRLLAHDWLAPEPVKVRIGVHVGDAIERADNYFGPDLNLAARIMAAAHGGQILACDLAVEDAGIETTSLGAFRLRDIEGPVHLHQVTPPGTAATFPPPRTPSDRRSTLPAQRSSFVPRPAEVNSLRNLLGQANPVTIVGVGGVGKTRLAIEVGATELPHRPVGVLFVDLAQAREPSEIPRAFLSGIGHVADPAIDWIEQLSATLGTGEGALLVLDNCEHLVDEVAAHLESLMARIQDLDVLATSRQPLDVDGEHVFRVPSLDTQTAVRLFTERALAAKDDFDPSAIAMQLEELCSRLDGIPLAIELAAARSPVMSIGEMLERLDDRFALLATRRRGRPSRQQTLHSTIEWSYDLLDDDERNVLESLSVFAASASIDGAAGLSGMADTAALAVVESLVAKSLVVTTSNGAGGTRYTLVETIREFLLAALQDRNELQDMRRRHRDWLLDYLGATDTSFVTRFDADELAERRKLRFEARNMLAAMAWSVDQDEHALGARLLASRLVWDADPWLAEGAMQHLPRVLESPDVVGRDRALALLQLGAGSMLMAPLGGWVQPVMEAVALLRQVADPHGLAWALEFQAAAMGLGGYHTVAPVAEEISKLLSDTDPAAAGLTDAMAESHRGHWEDALRIAQAGNAWWKRAEPGGTMQAMLSITASDAAAMVGDHDTALELSSQVSSECSGDHWSVWEPARRVYLHATTGDTESAIASLVGALDHYESHRHNTVEHVLRIGLCQILLNLGERERATTVLNGPVGPPNPWDPEGKVGVLLHGRFPTHGRMVDELRADIEGTTPDEAAMAKASLAVYLLSGNKVPAQWLDAHREAVWRLLRAEALLLADTG